MVDGTCCRGQRRSRVLRAAGSGGIWRSGELGYSEGTRGIGDDGGSILYFRIGHLKNDARVALCRRPNSTLKVLSRTTPPIQLHCQLQIRLTMKLSSQIVASRKTWEDLLPAVKFNSIPFG